MTKNKCEASHKDVLSRILLFPFWSSEEACFWNTFYQNRAKRRQLFAQGCSTSLLLWFTEVLEFFFLRGVKVPFYLCMYWKCTFFRRWWFLSEVLGRTAGRTCCFMLVLSFRLCRTFSAMHLILDALLFYFYLMNQNWTPKKVILLRRFVCAVGTLKGDVYGTGAKNECHILGPTTKMSGSQSVV